MRSEEDLETAKKALDNRLEQYELGLLHAFNQPKRDVIVAVLHDDEDPESIIEAMESELRGNLDLSGFIQIQAAKNAAHWCMGDLDSI